MIRPLALLLTLAATLPAMAQTPVRVGPMDVRNALGEIAADGAAAQAAARSNLGLGSAALLSVGTGAGSVAAGNDARITGALQASGNLSALPSPATARINLGLGSIATQAADAVTITGGSISGTTVSLGSVTATGGSTARTLADVLADRHNVRSLGAMGDGTAVDLPALTSGAGPWFLPRGTYNTGAAFAYLNPGSAVRRWTNGGGAGVIKTTDGVQSGNIAFIKSAPAYDGPGTAITNLFNGQMQCSLCFQNYVSGAATLGQPASGYQYNWAASGILGAVINTSGYEAQPDANDGRTALQAVSMRLWQAGQGDLVAYGATGNITGVRPGSTYFLGAPVASMFSGDFSAGVDGPYIDVDEIQIRDNGYLAAAAGLVRNFYRNATGAKISSDWPWMGIRLQSVGATPIDVFYSMSGKARIGIDFATLQGNLIDYSGAATQAAITLAAGQRIYGNATNANARGTNISSDTVLGAEYLDYETATGWNMVVGGVPILQAAAGGVSVTQLRITSPAVPATASSACSKGQIAYDTGFIYVCVAANTWKRAALASW